MSADSSMFGGYEFDPDKTPLAPPPEGVTPNFENGESNGWIAKSLIYTFIPLMLVFLALRIWSRVRFGKFGADDGEFFPGY